MWFTLELLVGPESPWNSQAGIEGSPQDVLEGSTGISSDRNSVHPSARRPSKTIQRKQQQLQKTNSLIRLHGLKKEKNRISLFRNTNSIFSSNIPSNRAPAVFWKNNNQIYFQQIIYSHRIWPTDVLCLCTVYYIRWCIFVYLCNYLFFKTSRICFPFDFSHWGLNKEGLSQGTLPVDKQTNALNEYNQPDSSTAPLQTDDFKLILQGKKGKRYRNATCRTFSWNDRAVLWDLSAVLSLTSASEAVWCTLAGPVGRMFSSK